MKQINVPSTVNGFRSYMSQMMTRGSLNEGELQAPLLEDEAVTDLNEDGVALYQENSDQMNFILRDLSISGHNGEHPHHPHESFDYPFTAKVYPDDEQQSAKDCMNESNRSTSFFEVASAARDSRRCSCCIRTRVTDLLFANDNIATSFLRTRVTDLLFANNNIGTSSCDDERNGLELRESNFTRKPSSEKNSLAFSPWTHTLFKFLIPSLLLTNHVLFFYAQTKPMWNLSYKVDINITATAATLKSKAAFDAINLPHKYEYVKKENKIVETFTYMDAIRKLWKGDGLGEAKNISKVAAALLILFSGVWPHLKLILVFFCWIFPFRHSQSDDTKINTDDKKYTWRLTSSCLSNHRPSKPRTIRSPFLHTLSTFGKWSLADVMVVCILIAVLHLDWNVNPDEIRSGVEKELPTVLSYLQSKYPDEVENCKDLLNFECVIGKALVIHYPACMACETLIKNAYYHPQWAVQEGKEIIEGITLDGGGYAQLRVLGMIGTYYFCGAVIMSIFLSFIVDSLDAYINSRIENEWLEKKKNSLCDEMFRTNEVRNATKNRRENGHPLTQPFLSHSRATDDVSMASQSMDRIMHHHHGPAPTTNCLLLKQTLLVILSLLSLPLVCFAVSIPTMERLVYGGVPFLLNEVLGMVWKQEYSLISLVSTTGEAGGWDTFLMITFGIFVVVGPIIRSVAIVLHLLLGLLKLMLGDCIDQPRLRTSLRISLHQFLCKFQKCLSTFIISLGVFCSWEVFIPALVMIQLEMPSITDTIYQSSICQQADPEHGPTCIEVQFNALNNFLLVGVTWIILIITSNFVVDLCSDGNDQLNDSKNRYEYGDMIPRRRRANLSSDQSWKGALSEIDFDDIDADIGEDLYSPLQQQDNSVEERKPLEEIVFV